MDRDGNFRIKRHFSVIAHGPDVVELRWGIWNPISFTVTDDSGTGRLFRLVSRLDGTISKSRLAKEEGVPQSDVEALLDELIEMDVVEREPTSALDHYLATSVPTVGSAEATKPHTVTVIGDEQLGEDIIRILRASLPKAQVSRTSDDDPGWKQLTGRDISWLLDGVAFQDRVRAFEAWRGSYVVFASRSINPIHFRVLNRVAMALEIPWLHAAVDGPFLMIGPTIVPRRSACYECFEKRVLMNLREAAGYQRYKKALVEGQIVHGTQPLLAGVSSLLASHVALEAVNFATTNGAFTLNQALTIHLPTMEFAFNEILRVPGCAACGSLPERDDRSLYFDMRAFLSDDSAAG
jgi:bacteriocin biosynthesis cyclodehydratase domain-containing protein